MATITATVPITATYSPEPPPLSQQREPLKLKGALENYDHFDVTPIIGREYPTANLKVWLQAPNSDDLLRDLAITSQPIIVPPTSVIEAAR